MEKIAEGQGTQLQDLTLTQMDAIWNEVKKQNRLT
jgi:uncharacterized protein YabN with tetrapyrrole methylase and pyrophosphatase domain